MALPLVGRQRRGRRPGGAGRRHRAHRQGNGRSRSPASRVSARPVWRSSWRAGRPPGTACGCCGRAARRTGRPSRSAPVVDLVPTGSASTRRLRGRTRPTSSVPPGGHRRWRRRSDRHDVCRLASPSSSGSTSSRPTGGERGGPDPGAVVDQLLGAVGSVLRGLAAEQPLLVVFDDLSGRTMRSSAFVRQLPDRVPGRADPRARPRLATTCSSVHPALAASGRGHLTVSLDPLDRRQRSS